MAHYFVTVGTSQLNKTFLLDASKKRILDSLLRESTADAYDATSELNGVFQERLRQHWKNATPAFLYPPEVKNPFGAEITTLWHMLRRDNAPFPLPRNDRFYVLTSDTMAGILAGRVLTDFLQFCWSVPNESIQMHPVHNLNTNPGTELDATGALHEFANLLVAALNHSVANAPVKPAPARHFVMTGGFKSLVPILTWFALAYSIPLTYLFEESECPVRELRLPLKPAAREDILAEIKVRYPGLPLPPLARF